MRRWAWGIGVLFSVASACSSQERSAAPTSPVDSTTAALAGQLSVPDGFKVAYFARNLPGVRFMALGADGAVYASEPGAGKVVRVWDVDGDGVADSVATVVDGLNRPHGLAFHGGYLYIANTNSVVRVRLGSDGRAAGAPEELTRIDGGGGHWSRTIVFGADSMMYVSIGSTCNLCIETSPERAAVMRYDANGQNGQRFAWGLRNAVGMAVDPATHALWVSQNERDNLTPDHQNLPPEEINILHEGGDYGWPYCYTLHGAAVPNAEYHDTARCATTVPAALEMQAHSAPLGITFLAAATQFPDAYRGDLLVAFHGSWDRDVPTGAKVVRVRVANGAPVSAEDFVAGWQRPDGSRWGRPVDVMVYRDGSVLVSDDLSGAIYRVSH
jgi:glucose/arabinose dehydrogenase